MSRSPSARVSLQRNTSEPKASETLCALITAAQRHFSCFSAFCAFCRAFVRLLCVLSCVLAFWARALCVRNRPLFCAGNDGAAGQPRTPTTHPTNADAGHLGLPAVPAQEGQAEEEGQGGSPRRSPHAQHETSDAPSVGSSAGALSAHDAPSPSPDTDADLPPLLTLAEAAAQLAAAQLEWQRRMQRRERRAPLDEVWFGNPVPRLVNYRACFLGWPDDEGNLARSRSSTPDLRDARKCETCGLNPPEDWLGGTECALCFSEH